MAEYTSKKVVWYEFAKRKKWILQTFGTAGNMHEPISNSYVQLISEPKLTEPSLQSLDKAHLFHRYHCRTLYTTGNDNDENHMNQEQKT